MSCLWLCYSYARMMMEYCARGLDVLGGAPATLIYSGSRVTLKVSWSATGRCPSRLQLYLLYTRKVGLYPYADRSFMQSCAASSFDLVRLELVSPAHPCPSECTCG